MPRTQFNVLFNGDVPTRFYMTHSELKHNSSGVIFGFLKPEYGHIHVSAGVYMAVRNRVIAHILVMKDLPAACKRSQCWTPVKKVQVGSSQND